jgi:hypothetical protein
MSALPSAGKPPAVTKTSVATDVHESFDVHGDLFAQIALDAALGVDHPTDLADLLLGKLLDADFGGDSSLSQNEPGTIMTDPVNVGKSDIDTLFPRQVDTCYSSHDPLLLSLTLFVFRVGADDPHHPVPADDFTLGANALD